MNQTLKKITKRVVKSGVVCSISNPILDVSDWIEPFERGVLECAFWVVVVLLQFHIMLHFICFCLYVPVRLSDSYHHFVFGNVFVCITNRLWTPTNNVFCKWVFGIFGPQVIESFLLPGKEHKNSVNLLQIQSFKTTRNEISFERLKCIFTFAISFGLFVAILKMRMILCHCVGW